MSYAVRHFVFWMALVPGCALCLSACDLDAVPTDPTRDLTPSSDAGTDTTALTCTPGETQCQGPLPLVEQCTEDGNGFVFKESCEAGTYCDDGVCTAIATQCADNQDDGLPFATSSTALTFETSDDLKSTTASLEIENCGDSDLWLQRTEVRQSSPSAGRAVFSIINAGDFQQLRIPPGISERITVKYEPAFAFSREAGNLRLQVIGETYHEFDIPLRPRSYCVSATPAIDTGLIQGAKTGSVFLQNCGTEPVEIESVSTVPDKEDSQPQATITLEQSEGFAPLEAGDFLELPYRVSGGRLGQFNHRIIYHMKEAWKFADERLATKVAGRVASVECRSLEIAPPRIEQGDVSVEGWEAGAKAGEAVELQMGLPNPLSAGQVTPIYRFRPPDGSRSRWIQFDRTMPTLGKNEFTPDIPGTYRVDVNYIDDAGRPQCEWKTARIEVRPEDRFYVDLNWKTHGDLIPDDVGFGRGADLNLHVLPASELDRQLPWGDSRGDCFGYGEFPSPDSPTASDRSRCELFQGDIYSTSVSGAHREAVGFSVVDQDRYYIAIHAWSLSGFPNAVAELRIFHKGDLIEDFEIDPDDWEGRDTPESLEDLLRQRIYSANDVWILGYWDAATEMLVASPTRYSGFPN